MKESSVESNLVAQGSVGSPISFANDFYQNQDEVEVGNEDQDLDIDLTGPELINPNLPHEDEEQDDQIEKKDEEEDEEDEEDNDYSGYSGSALLGLSLQKDGLLGEDFKVAKNLSGKALKDSIINNWKTEFESSKDSYLASKGLSQDVIEYANYLAEGMRPEVLESVRDQRQYAKLDITGDDEIADDNRKSLILAMYADKGISERRAESLYNSVYESSEEHEEASIAKEYFQSKEKAIIQTEQAYAQERTKLVEEEKRKTLDIVHTSIRNRVVSGYKISDKEAKALEKAVLEPTEIIDYTDPSTGKTSKVAMTKYELAMNDLNNDINKQLLVAHILINGLDIEKIKDEGKRESDDEIMRALDKKALPPKKSSNRQNNNNDNYYFETPVKPY